MNNQEIRICRNSSEGKIVIVNMQTCQKLIVKDKAMMALSDDELKLIYKNFGVVSQNNRV